MYTGYNDKSNDNIDDFENDENSFKKSNSMTFRKSGCDDSKNLVNNSK